ncbi:MAG: hypothetical protein KGJ86_06160 [Chloroflexota bacterium]|nr:hypothetical protein [Chloroflexota bacterium]
MATSYEWQIETATFHSSDARPGACAVCGKSIDQRRVWDACSYITTSEIVIQVHKDCAHVIDKGRVGGGRKIVSAPAIQVRVKVPVLHDA